MPGDLFRTDALAFSPLSRAVVKAARPLLERSLGLQELSTLYEQIKTLDGSFPRRALHALDIALQVSGNLAAVPASGPLLVVANHPLGTLDGLAVMAALESVRSDVRLLANHVLAAIPEMQELCFFVDPFGGPEAAAHSRAGLRAAHLWLRRGGTLVMFPSGEVAHGPEVDGTRKDSPWSDTVGRLAVATGATILPVHIAGTNSSRFYAAGKLHRRLRTVLLVREMLLRRGREVALTIGQPICGATRGLRLTPEHTSPGVLTQELRSAVEALGASATLGSRLANEVAALPDNARLAHGGDFDVFVATAPQIPAVLQEIGRLREITFRAVGEGTGRRLDLDDFDRDYQHLFLWDRRARVVVGAYRIGEVDRLMKLRGVEGLYTQQLFRFDERFVSQMGPALELGRSWIRAEYQKNYNALLLLWRGIGRFVAERSTARVLFGPVSISSRYTDTSHALLMAFLEQNFQDRSLAPLVEGRHKPPAPIPSHVVLPATIDEADRLVASLEADGKGVPVLLRHYLKLKARLIGFNVDPDFGDALDALMMVDLTQVDRHILHRYIGADNARMFLARNLTAAA